MNRRPILGLKLTILVVPMLAYGIELHSGAGFSWP
jgi:hypothetical protein